MAAGGADAVRGLQLVGRQAGACANQRDQAELPDVGRAGEFVETDVALGALGG